MSFELKYNMTMLFEDLSVNDKYIKYTVKYIYTHLHLHTPNATFHNKHMNKIDFVMCLNKDYI